MTSHFTHDAITLRDYIAAQIMAALMSRDNYPGPIGRTPTAQQAVDAADTLIGALAKLRPGEPTP